MADWKEYQLGKIASFRYGKMPKAELLSDEGFPAFSGYRFVGKYPEWNCEEGKVIIVARGVGGTGDVKLASKKCFVTNLSIIIDFVDNVVDNRFFYYKYLLDNLKYLDSGSAQSQITIQDLNRIYISLPPLPEQQAIAEVLSSLDYKIDLLHRQNKTLEALAETLFRQWFVEEAEESWERKSLDQIANYLNGLALQKYPVNNGDSLPVIKIRELNQGITESTDKCSREIPEKYIIQDGDILFSWSGSLQIMIWHDGEGALNQHLFKVTSANYPKWFYYLATKHHLENFRAIAESKSTTMGHIQRHHLTEAFASIPPKELFNQYDESLSPLIEKLIKNNAQIKNLTKQRDTLLPKLMSGEARVKF
jgi:type I restriction enzyme S subunit